MQVAHTEQLLQGDNGIALNGIALNGIALNGIALNGIALNGIALNGIALNGIALNGIALNGIALNGAGMEEQEQNLRALLTYLVECALPESQQVTMNGVDGTPLFLDGLFGLAPEWASGALSARGERLISACLAARTNAQGKHVQISLRSAELETTPVERALYTHHEGAFWGNLFGDSPAMYTCTAAGTDISGRSCTDGSCGFENLGPCAQVCGSRDAVNGYNDCAGDDAALNVFLTVTEKIDFGAAHACINRDGTPWCWGENSRQQLGDGTYTSRDEARPVSGIPADVVEIGGGEAHTCARRAGGEVWCWGDNRHGQAGLDTYARRISYPSPVTELGQDAASLSVGARHACALTTGGAVWCWGDNRYGQVGNGSHEDEHAPVPVEALGEDVARLVTGDSAAHTCAVTNTGALHCWGRNRDGQLGDGTDQDRSAPVEVTFAADGAPFTEVTDACTGSRHSCAVTASGEAWCWGDNELGQLGAGTSDSSERPVRVALGGAVAQGSLSCGANHACAILEDGSLHCWGDNSHGQRGNGEITTQATDVPSEVTGLPGLTLSVTADADRTCALLDDESTWCWGHDPDGWFFSQAENSAEPVLYELSGGQPSDDELSACNDDDSDARRRRHTRRWWRFRASARARR